MVWYSHLFQNFPQFVVIHTVEGFGIVNKAEIDFVLLSYNPKSWLDSPGQFSLEFFRAFYSDDVPRLEST